VNHQAGTWGGRLPRAVPQDVARRLGPVLLPAKGKLTRSQLLPHLRDLKEAHTNTRDQLVRRFATLPFEAIDRELREKALVLVMGGGGGTAYVYLGGDVAAGRVRPAAEAAVGTSMGSVLALFRSRMPRFEQDEIVASCARSLAQALPHLSTENRYGPAALRLFLRSGNRALLRVDTGSEGRA